MHGGEIAAHSDGPGQGSTFTVTMPVCESLAPRASFRQADAARVACRGLIIDDNRDAATTMAMLVGELGGSTRIAHDPGNGLEAVQEYQPDIVFLDIGMPGIDGVSPNAPAAISKSHCHRCGDGVGTAAGQTAGARSGFDAHLTKPVDLEALARILAASPPSHGT
jgi:CheY-like chemotaxis protein